ncbi:MULTISPECIES: hypothetical protein [Filomicrobium]|uniref:Uncharacterized protein n=1 Tax=Filomicrobium insigne TaxID=418854 RepID=A0A1H0MB73_9HYPH|nr:MULTISPECIES: hypothetical protein [Filomicrobium]MCV0368891.1 hypothetical protein [Filomicrobium sp.]SDO77738.1 hypothetical protein SAMN04488061_1627 [Filomicrobium insigne]
MTTISSLNNAALSLFKSTQPERMTSRNTETNEQVKVGSGMSTLPGAAYQQAAAAAGKFSVETASPSRKVIATGETTPDVDPNETSGE